MSARQVRYTEFGCDAPRCAVTSRVPGTMTKTEMRSHLPDGWLGLRAWSRFGTIELVITCDQECRDDVETQITQGKLGWTKLVERGER